MSESVSHPPISALWPSLLEQILKFRIDMGWDTDFKKETRHPPPKKIYIYINILHNKAVTDHAAASTFSF